MSWTVLVFAFGLALGVFLLRRKMRRAWFGVVIVTAAIPLTALLGVFPAHLFGENAALVAAVVVAPFPMLAGLLSGWLTAWILRRAGLTRTGGAAIATRMTHEMPQTRGRLTRDRDLSTLTWLRVGGPADWLFQPADVQDLSDTLAALDPGIEVFPMGVGSNLIVRDGGLRAVVVRLGRGFNDIRIDGDTVIAGAAALDAHVARRAAEAGLDLTFLRTIPGTVGGAVRMNAGCYGSYIADVFVSAAAVLRDGSRITLCADDLAFGYRHSTLPEGAVFTSVTLQGPTGDPAMLLARMEEQLAKRDATQPTKDRSAGSTFRNPSGFSSTGRPDDTDELKAWKLIDAAGLRGARRGGAKMSEKHSNFLINASNATAADLEGLGEEVRKKVYDESGLTLEWEIMRVGEP